MGSYHIPTLKECDIFIYQPINKEHKLYTTDTEIENNVLSYLKPSCIKISFPYIYMPAIFTIHIGENFNSPHNFDLSLLKISHVTNTDVNIFSKDQKKVINS